MSFNFISETIKRSAADVIRCPGPPFPLQQTKAGPVHARRHEIRDDHPLSGRQRRVRLWLLPGSDAV